MTQSRALLLVSGLATAYLAILLGVLIHEVVGHGWIAVWLGGEFSSFEIAWDGMGWAATTLPDDAPTSHRILHLAGGAISTTLIGGALLLIAHFLRSRAGLRFHLTIVGLIVILDGLPYLFFNSLWPRGPGDFGRIHSIWLREGWFAPQLVRWSCVLVGGAGTWAVLGLGTRGLYRSLLELLRFSPERSALSHGAWVTFFVVPSCALCLMFDWSQLIAGVGMAPRFILLAFALGWSVFWHRFFARSVS